MKLKYIILLFVFAVIIAFIIGRKSGENKIITQIRYDTIRTDTIYSERYVPKIVEKVRTDTIYTEKIITDTIEIVKQFQETIHYSDTLYRKDEFSMIISDVIFQNRIIDRKWTYKDLKGTVHVTEFVEKEKRHLSAGLQISTFNEFNTSFAIMYQDKRKRAYTALYDPLNNVYSFGIYFRIF